MGGRSSSRLIIVGIVIVVLIIIGITNLFGIGGGVARLTSGIQGFFYHTFVAGDTNAQIKMLQDENAALAKKIVDTANLERDNHALKDQFQTSGVARQDLLPAHIIGAPAFVPGKSSISRLVIDQGKQQGIQIGQAVIYKDNLIGKITKASDFISEVTLITAGTYSLKAKDVKSGSDGIIQGLGDNEMVFDHVLTNDTLKKDDLIQTVGDINTQGIGLPSHLIIGKVISVDKKPSELFQSAKVAPLINVSTLSMVFVITKTH